MCLGIPGKIIEEYEENGLKMGIVDFSGVKNKVCLEYTPEARSGDYAIIHVGFALSLLNEKEASETLEYLNEINRLNNEAEEK